MQRLRTCPSRFWQKKLLCYALVPLGSETKIRIDWVVVTGQSNMGLFKHLWLKKTDVGNVGNIAFSLIESGRV